MMLTNIPDVILTYLLAILGVVCVAVMVQYSRFVSNRKDNKKMQLAFKDDADLPPVEKVNVATGEKFWLGYILIPALFVVLCSTLALFIGDIACSRGYVAGNEEVVLVTAAVALVLYIAADRWLIRNVGDAAFYDRVEEQIVDGFLSPAASDAAEAKADDLKAAGFSDDTVRKIVEMLNKKG